MLNIYPTHMLWLKVMPGGNKSGVCPVWHGIPVSGDSSWLGGPDYSSLFHLQPTNHQDLDDNEEKEKSTKIIILTENVCFSFNKVLISAQPPSCTTSSGENVGWTIFGGWILQEKMWLAGAWGASHTQWKAKWLESESGKWDARH